MGSGKKLLMFSSSNFVHTSNVAWLAGGTSSCSALQAQVSNFPSYCCFMLLLLLLLAAAFVDRH